METMDIDTLRDILKWFVETAQAKIYCLSNYQGEYGYPDVSTKDNDLGQQENSWIENFKSYPDFKQSWIDMGLRCVHFKNGSARNHNYSYRRATIHFSNAYTSAEYGLSFGFALDFDKAEDISSDNNRDTIRRLKTELYNTLGKNGKHSSDSENYDSSFDEQFRSKYHYQDQTYPVGVLDNDEFQALYENYLTVMEELNEFKQNSSTVQKHEGKQMDKNIILYGTPGTGKTYSSIQYAVAIIEEKPVEEIRNENYGDVFKRYTKYKEDGLIAFTTFHQSFGYEEFIEGIRPAVAAEDSGDANGDIEYEIRDGIFKSFCNNAGTPLSEGSDVDLGIGKSPTVWKVSLEGTGDNPTRRDCMENDHIRIGYDGYGENITDDLDYSKYGGKRELNAFYNKMQIGDIVMSCYSMRTVDAIGVITGDPEWVDNYQNYKRQRSVKWLVKGIDENIVEMNNGKTMTLPSVYELRVSVADAISILRKTNPDLFSAGVKIPNRVFIIDEINRGNISKIFGELITLIEPSKRIGASEEQRARLPYSDTEFGVPNNVYIIGTMNTADRSIALIDTALRRRFNFVEMLPDSSLLKDINIEGINIARMLDTLNGRITVLLDREHTIGHSYLLPLRDNPTSNELANIFENEIMPLLQEYFYDDYEKIYYLLGDNQKENDEDKFIVRKGDTYGMFGDTVDDLSLPEMYYEINHDAFLKKEAYAYLVS